MPDDEYGSIEDHPNWPDVVDAIHKYGDWTKEQLVSASYDNSGGTVPPARRIGDRVVRQISQCPLLIDGMYGGTCQNQNRSNTHSMLLKESTMDQWIELTAMLSVLAAGFLVWLYSVKIYFDFKPSNLASNSRKSKT